MNTVFGKLKNIGNLDYVGGWYKKASDYSENTSIECALVSTNSVTQGEQPAILFKPLFEKGIHIRRFLSKGKTPHMVISSFIVFGC